VVRTARGGAGVLKNIINDLKQYSFSGYIKVLLEKDTMNSTGYLVIDQGVPAMSIYQFERVQPREIKRIYAGDKSLRFVWEDAQDKTALIELHSRVPTEEFERRFPDAKLSGAEEFEPEKIEPPEPPPKRKALKKKIEKVEKVEKIEKLVEKIEPPSEEDDPIWIEIQNIRQQGYNVERLEAAFKRNRVGAKKEIAIYQKKIQEMHKLEKLLDNLPQVGLDEEIESVRRKLINPELAVEVKEEIEVLKEVIRKRIEKTKMTERKIEEDLKNKKREEKVGDLYELILQYQSGQISGETPQVCDKCSSMLDPKGVCQSCKESEQTAIQVTLPQNMTFDNFVVGQNSKFAQAAALAVARAPDKAYNPLFVYGKTGLGKTHLLSAIAVYIADSDPKMMITYTTGEKYAEDLEIAIKNNKVTEFRDEYRNTRILLIDDFQFLAGKEMAQEELLYIVEQVMRDGGQIIVASDRLPGDIPRLNERLMAKIQGGLIADIQTPDKSTRMKILGKKVEDRGKQIPDEVLDYIAERVKTNVRELEAALNRLIAFATVMKIDIDLQLAKEILIPTMTSTEDQGELQFDIEIKSSHSYMIEEDRPVQSNKLLIKKMEDGYRGLEITRMNPGQVREKFGTKAEVLWLTDKESKTERTISPSLEMILHLLEEFNSREGKSVVLIDGLQYLISNTSFEGVLRFIRRLIDDFSETESILMLSISPGTLKEQELSILERELEIIKFS